MTDYRFGWFERFGLSVILLMIWGVLAAASMALISEHGTDPSAFADAIQYANLLMFIAIGVFLLGRPIATSLPDAYRSVRDVVA